MDESETVCPLCCEELDISDQQFFPCKCGYQVCMWCWHRIRESESGLCPACRTPYGDDPHEFSAVDVAEVLKANKEKVAAEKKERERLRDGDEVGVTGPMDLPKDRSQLANMRVIRRNLVYAVGLPPSVATEDTLRKPEYFGQYGKIAKIVLNRTNVTCGDPRRASASAYVTFVHKEDTLACILALDGFFLDGRNVRASYGTSKYCSAFIKNVRCNNPDCTYLHCMGEAEDTFTKQEIQAGYVTSGRDVLARQQQIVAQALSEASGAAGVGTRRKVGGGGPSGTGRASTSPIFPPPCYDEPLKPSTASLVPPPAPVNRSVSLGGVAAAPIVPPGPVVKLDRSISMMASTSGCPNSVALAPARKGVIAASIPAAGSATAASVVAGVHSFGTLTGVEPPSAHTTLTPLTPLKRLAKGKSSSSLASSHEGAESVQLPPNMPVPKGFTPAEKAALLEQRREALAALARQQREMSTKFSAMRNVASHKANKNGVHSTSPTSPSSSVSSSSGPNAKLASSSNEFSVGSIGGTVIGPPGGAVGGSSLLGSSSSFGNPIGNHSRGLSIGGGSVERSGVLGGLPVGGSEPIATSSSLGGEIFTGQLPSRFDSAIGSHKDKWSSAAPGAGGSGLFGSGSSFGMGGGDLWGNEISTSSVGGQSGRTPGVIGSGGNGFGSIGSQRFGPAHGSNLAPGGSSNSGSSALASMLGVNLPTGTGSLRESTPLWNAPSQAPMASLNGSSVAAPGVIGSGGSGIVIGRGGGSGLPFSSGASSGGFRGSGSVPTGSGNNSDIALLQSLLPGVHITSGQPATPTASGGFGSVGGQAIGGFNLGPSPQGESWGGAAASVGGGGSMKRAQQDQRQSSIW